MMIENPNGKQSLLNDVVINRSILNWTWYKDVNTYKLFTHFIYKANYFDDVDDFGVEIKRGQLKTGLEKLHYETGLSVTSIRTSISKLTLTGELTSKSTNKYRIITLLNYNTHQLANNQLDKQNDKQIASTLTASNKEKELLKKLKEYKEEIERLKDKKSKPKRFVQPTIEELNNYCLERKNNVDAIRFNDHYESNGWKVGKNKMKDWKAAIRTWEKNSYNTNNKKDSNINIDEEFAKL